MSVNKKPSASNSIIIRTKNEARWIDHCLSAIAAQSIQDYEIILVITIQMIALQVPKKYTDKIVNVTEFYPGKAINKGIRASSGKFIAITSGHCIPRIMRLKIN